MCAWFVRNGRRLSIRAKIVSALFFFVILPLGLGVIGLDYIGYQRFRVSQGIAAAESTAALSLQLQQIIEAQIDALADWLAFHPIYEAAFSEIRNIPESEEPATAYETETMEAQWPGLPPQAAELRPLLATPLAAQLQQFQTRHPEFLQLELIDQSGRLLAATKKPERYNQRHHPWWPHAIRGGYSNTLLTNTQETGGVPQFHLTIAFWDDTEATLAIILHAILKPPNPNLFLINGRNHATALLLLHEPEGPKILEPSGEAISIPELPNLGKVLGEHKLGWTYFPVGSSGTEQLVAMAPLLPPVLLPLRTRQSAPPPGWQDVSVLTSRLESEVLAPVRKQLSNTGIIAITLVLGCSCLGYLLTGLTVVHPLMAFSTAARTVAARARQDFPATETSLTLAELDKLTELGTTDEIRQLAEDFRFMAEQVLKRHELLESEIAKKTAELNRDLEVAREFQEALLPDSYPIIPSPGLASDIRLEFHHIYRPAKTVGGDFFDVLQLDDYRAGVFIADVMGHGARSALVTSILHTLLQGFQSETSDPAALLTAVNQRFHTLLRGGSDPVFVTAFYLILDTRSKELRFASAGHPSPILLEAKASSTRDLLETRPDPALGILPQSQYRNHTAQFAPGDLIFLFTDGIHEACSTSDEEFGLPRLRTTVAESKAESGVALNWGVLDAVLNFTMPVPPPDDICLVSIRAAPTPTEPCPPSI